MNKRLPKQAPTFSEQVSRLLDIHGCAFGNEQRAEIILARVNYYRLLGYFLPFKDSASDKYPGVVFEHVYMIYEFDRLLRMLLLELIEEIDTAVRTQIAYHHSHEHGSDGYVDSTLFRNAMHHTKLMDDIRDIVTKNEKNPVVKHHREQYSSRFPLWVIIEFFSIRMVSELYANMVRADQKKVARALGCTSDQLYSWLYCLTQLRNRCAHSSRLYYWHFVALPTLPKECNRQASIMLFDQMLVVKLLYQDKHKWKSDIFS